MGNFASGIRRLRAAFDSQQDRAPALASGARFARQAAHEVIEIAHVISIDEHASGVPHVRFTSRWERASVVFDHGPRTLALPSFVERYGTTALGEARRERA